MSAAAGPAADAPPAPAGPRAGGYIPVLDGLRAVSIGLVLVGHTLDREGTIPGLGRPRLPLSSTGVAVFFVVSGYLITLLLLREERPRRVDQPPAPSISAASCGSSPPSTPICSPSRLLAAAGLIPGVPWYDYVASIAYVRNIFGRADETTHLWSLSLEEQFYLIWPASLLVVAARSAPALLAAAIARRSPPGGPT